MRLFLSLLLLPLTATAQVWLFGSVDMVKQPRWDDTMVPALSIKTGIGSRTFDN